MPRGAGPSWRPSLGWSKRGFRLGEGGLGAGTKGMTVMVIFLIFFIFKKENVNT